MKMMVDFEEIRKLFPITQMKYRTNGRADEKQLIYLDHAASTHPPQPVLDCYVRFIERYYANVHRANYQLARVASELFDSALATLMQFIHGDTTDHSLIMTSNTTEALNLASYVMSKVDGITLCTAMEHHSNDLPHRRYGAVQYVNLTEEGTLDLDDLKKKLKTHRVKLVAITGASNVTGFLPDIHAIAKLAHEHGAKILVDGAQLLAHHPLDMRKKGDPERIDFFAAAGHKAYAPFGSAFLYAPCDLLDQADPFLPGGGTVVYVTATDVLHKASPDRHGGGTPNIAGIIAFAESINFLQYIGMEEVREHEKRLCQKALEGLSSIEGVTLYGPLDANARLGVIAFNVLDLSHEFVANLLNTEAGIAARNGSFCAQPYLLHLLKIKDVEKFKSMACSVGTCSNETLPGAVRVSFGLYNTEEEVDELLRVVKMIRDQASKKT